MLNIVIVGTGNVAKQLHDHLLECPIIRKLQVLARNEEGRDHFDEGVLVFGTESVMPDVDIFLIAVSDGQISAVSDRLKGKKGLIAHTAGSVPMEVLKAHPNHGVFYPLQTFSKARKVAFDNIPICIEANTPENQRLLGNLASGLTKEIHSIDTQQRKGLHLAAVFANNFTNHMYHLANEICKERGVSFDLLKPLILETAQKIEDGLPLDMQTGPARRNDTAILNGHLGALQNLELKETYRIISKSISNTYNR